MEISNRETDGFFQSFFAASVEPMLVTRFLLVMLLYLSCAPLPSRFAADTPTPAGVVTGVAAGNTGRA